MKAGFGSVDEVQPGERLAVTGQVGAHRRRDRRSGPAYIQAPVRSPDGTEVLCTWWEEALAPKEGSTVAVVGEGWRDGSLTARRTQLVGESERPFEHRLLDYYQACLEAEQASDEQLRLGSRSVLVLSDGRAPIAGARTVLPPGEQVKRWCDARRVAGEAETVYAGYPIVTSEPDSGRGESPITAPLLMTEVRVVAEGDRFALETRSAAMELNGYGLALLNIPAEEREEILNAFESLDLHPDPTQRVAEALDFLREANVLGADHLDPRNLRPVEPGQRVQNSSIAYVTAAEQVSTTRALFEDFNELRARPVDGLRTGPVGVLLGHEPPDPYPEPEPSPAVLPSNLEQERGITAAMKANLTVVTGPPGTGKSQVLANTVAAALAAGETVLLASKNNHAIDVVVERVRQAHPDAEPVRLGRAELRVEAARLMGAALARPAVEDSGLDRAKAAWSEVRARVMAPYDRVRERDELLREIDRQEQRCERVSGELPEGCRHVGADVDTDLLLASHQMARRSHDEAGGLRNRWFWQRRRYRKAQTAADDATRTMLTLAGMAAQPALTSALTGGTRSAVLELVGRMITLASEQSRLAELRTYLDLLPTVEEADQQIEASFRERLAPAAELYGAGWRHRLRRRNAPGRAPAAAYHARLAEVASSGGGARRIRADAGNALDAFPVWAVTSLPVGNALPLTPGMFDLAIIDEASQSDIPSALPVLYRAKRAVILGDPRQLTHITTVGSRIEAVLAERCGLTEEQGSEFNYVGTSLYALAASRSSEEPIFLRRHFRSHPDIVEFSNRTFYGSRLVVETDPSRYMDGSAVRWHDVVGRFERNALNRSALNKPEAEAVLDELALAWEGVRGTGRTLGVVSPFRAQVDLLRDLVVQRFPDMVGNVTIDTAHGYQGDERDVMIMSPVVTEGMTEFLVQHAGNPNLVNVAVTRARARLVIVGDHRACLDSGNVLSALAQHASDIGGRS